MKSTKLFAATLAVTLWGGMAWAQVNSFSFNVNQPVPDDSPLGLTLTTNLTGLGSSISDITLTLDITGGFNGDLYAYLAGPNGGLAILLNRVGVNGSSAFGYSDAGLNITFSDVALNGNIHDYQTVSGYAGQLNGGTWLADGRNVDPTTNGAVLAGTATTSDFSTFNGTDPNGTWTLFVADLSAGGQSTVIGWNLDITNAPEPSSFALLGTALAGFWFMRRRSMI